MAKMRQYENSQMVPANEVPIYDQKCYFCPLDK
jgi:hypothetical protein